MHTLDEKKYLRKQAVVPLEQWHRQKIFYPLAAMEKINDKIINTNAGTNSNSLNPTIPSQ